MDPSLIAEIVKQGLGYTLFIFACGGLIWQVKKIELMRDQFLEDSKQSDKDLREINEKRLEEREKMVLAMERGTTASNERTAGIQAQAQAIADLTRGFAALVLQQDSNRARNVELGERLERRQEEVLTIQRALTAQLSAACLNIENLARVTK